MRLSDPLPTFDGASGWLGAKPVPSPSPTSPLLVHFWSTRCPLCHEGPHSIARWRVRFPGLTVVAVYQMRADETLDAAVVERDARESMAIDYPCAVDGSGVLARRFDSAFAPSYYVFDAEHRLRHRQMGNAHLEVIETILERFLVKASHEREAY